MSRTDTIYVGTNLTAVERPVSLILGDVRQLTVDFGAYCGIEDTLIDSAAWALAESGQNVVSVGTSASSTKTTACPITAAQTGVDTVQVSVVLENGEVVIHLFRCEVTDPSNPCPVDRYED